VGTLSNVAVRSPSIWEDDTLGLNGLVDEHTDTIGTTANLVGVTSTGHLALARVKTILNVLDIATVALAAVLQASNLEAVGSAKSCARLESLRVGRGLNAGEQAAFDLLETTHCGVTGGQGGNSRGGRG
jgi:hypothetical protein